MDSTEVERLIESIRSETCNASITPGRLATVLCELLALLRWEEDNRMLADRLLKDELFREIVSQVTALKDFILEKLKEYDVEYYYEDDWDAMTESEQASIVRKYNNVVVLEGSRPKDPTPPSTFRGFGSKFGFRFGAGTSIGRGFGAKFGFKFG